jgi:hypothetical protein
MREHKNSEWEKVKAEYLLNPPDESKYHISDSEDDSSSNKAAAKPIARVTSKTKKYGAV